MRALLVLLALMLLGSSTVFISPASVSPNIATQSVPPPVMQPQSVPTLAEVRSNAWALQAQINAAAGRKTSSAGDGTGGSITAPAQITSDTAWVNKHVDFLAGMKLNITTATGPLVPTTLNLWANNSLLEGNALTTLLYPEMRYTGPCCQPEAPDLNIPWTINIYVTNSTVQNFGNFTLPKAYGLGGYDTGSKVQLFFDNATFKNIGATATNVYYGSGSNCDIQIHTCDNFIHDSTFDNYGTYGLGSALLQQNNAGQPTHGYVLRSKFLNPAGGCCGIAFFPRAQWNYFAGTGTILNPIVFLQRYFNAEANGEMLNFSYNYISGSSHTAIGIGGTLDGGSIFAPPGMKRGQYASVYSNFVNNSYYIVIQAYGNATNIYYKQNYISNLGPTFSNAFGMNFHSHNITIDTNYIFDLINTGAYSNGVCCHGIVLTDFGYNRTIKNNVMYNIGGDAFQILGQGLKFKGSGGPACLGTGSVECSDYTYRAGQTVLTNNYVNGINYYGVTQDSGYTTWYNNTFTNILGGPNTGTKALVHLLDGWDPDGLGTQMDWFGGTNITGQVLIDASPTPSRRSLVWVRSFQYGSLDIRLPNNTYGVHYQDSGPAGFWGRTFPCIDAQTPERAETWTYLPCDPMEDAQNLTASPVSTAWRPVAYWDYTHTPTYIPLRMRIDYTPIGPIQVVDTTTGQVVPHTVGSITFNMAPGDNYRVSQVGPGTNPPPEGSKNLTAGWPIKEIALGISVVSFASVYFLKPQGRARRVLLYIGVGAGLVFMFLLLQG